MTDISIFLATVNEVPPELEEQANDLEKVVDVFKTYTHDFKVAPDLLLYEVELVLKGKNPIYELDDLIFACTRYMKEWGCSAETLVKDLELILL